MRILTCNLLPGETADTFAKVLLKKIVDEQETEFVILTDLYGASVCTAMSGLISYPNVKLFTGMNLSMELAVCMEHADNLNMESNREIMQDAKEGIRYIDENCLNLNHEDF